MAKAKIIHYIEYLSGERPYTSLNRVLSRNESYIVTVQIDERLQQGSSLTSSPHPWVSVLGSNILPYSIWNWTSESKANVCNGRRNGKVLNLPIWNILFMSSHKKTKCLKLKVDLKRKTYEQNIYYLPLCCCQVYSRSLWELFPFSVTL